MILRPLGGGWRARGVAGANGSWLPVVGGWKAGGPPAGGTTRRPPRTADRPVRPPPRRRSRSVSRRSPARAARHQDVASQALLNFSIVRYSRVLAFDSLTPSTEASSALV